MVTSRVSASGVPKLSSQAQLTISAHKLSSQAELKSSAQKLSSQAQITRSAHKPSSQAQPRSPAHKLTSSAHKLSSRALPQAQPTSSAHELCHKRSSQAQLTHLDVTKYVKMGLGGFRVTRKGLNIRRTSGIDLKWDDRQLLVLSETHGAKALGL